MAPGNDPSTYMAEGMVRTPVAKISLSAVSCVVVDLAVTMTYLRKIMDVCCHDTVRKSTTPSCFLKISKSSSVGLIGPLLSLRLSGVGSITSACFSDILNNAVNEGGYFWCVKQRKVEMNDVCR